MITFKKSCDISFAKALVKLNMASYYEQYNIVWSDERFEQSWNEFENIQILKGGAKVGVLRLWIAGDALYIRDLQISKDHQSNGIGTSAVSYSQNIAKLENLKFLKLRVFESNPAKELYKRLGFVESKREGFIISMEQEIA
ncbi:GNAT family N-acetyltransferase [Marinomonas balearica]|uniref:GNAT family acetyltransferase n=1 Tax=Marinomonas balearica TaxID=491947 RepID=A0A4R6MDG5_9GAMM|nr:GNAT family N-acetyltransferase [Marinomonas balearica]TDO99747.1 GNAT family acetyltransferase [Marinomonas balearica]